MSSCAGAQLLIRVIENAAADTWRDIRHELDRMHLITLATPDGQVAHRSALSSGQQAIRQVPSLRETRRVLRFHPPRRLTARGAAVTRSASGLLAFTKVSSRVPRCGASVEAQPADHHGESTLDHSCSAACHCLAAKR